METYRFQHSLNFLGRYGIKATPDDVHQAVVSLLGEGEHGARKVIHTAHAVSRALLVFGGDPAKAYTQAKKQGLIFDESARTHMACVLSWHLADIPMGKACEVSIFKACLLDTDYICKATRILNAIKVNPELVAHILNKGIEAHELGQMTSEQLCPGSVPKPRERNMVRFDKVENTLLACIRCEKNTVTVVERMTRSMDEPTSKFCSCTNCGKRWRFC